MSRKNTPPWYGEPAFTLTIHQGMHQSGMAADQ